jgi:hypothetical protein
MSVIIFIIIMTETVLIQNDLPLDTFPKDGPKPALLNCVHKIQKNILW